MTGCWIGLGANIGDAHAAFEAAWVCLKNHPQIDVVNRSSLYETSPIGTVAGSAFLNAVCGISTDMEPLQLLNLLQSIETSLGRTVGLRWGPRVLDLDLLFVGEQIINEPRLVVPHPAAWYRRFVTVPLMEVAPLLIHPLGSVSLHELYLRLKRRPLRIGLDRRWLLLLEQYQDEVIRLFPEVEFLKTNDFVSGSSVWLQLAESDDLPPASHGIPVANLKGSPGEPIQRVYDFLAAIHDEPTRAGVW